MAGAGGNPWKISALISACYEFVLALFLLFQMLLSIVVLELTKYLPVSQTCSCCSRRHHNLFSSGHLPPFSPCREHNATRFKGIAGATRTPARFSRGLLPGRALSEDLSSNRKVRDHVSSSEKAGFTGHARSLSLSSVHKRKKRTPSLEDNALITQECNGETCKCIVSEIDLYDDLIEVSSEYLKQKDRGHEEVILSLLKALQSERRNLRTLYEELEEERIAAETAANETMGMILRLQEEKSALQMEADHYQRMAEEKALHDEQAIELLEEDLYQKEIERLLLEEELTLLRGRSYGDVLDVANNVDDASCFSEVSKPLLLLASIDEQEDDESGVNPQDYADQKCVLVVPEEYLEAGPVEDQPLKRLKSFTMHISKNPSATDRTVEGVLTDSTKHPETCQLFNDDEDDAKSILVQLSALEKQLLALEESERLHQAQAQDYLTCVFLKPDVSCVSNPQAEDKSEDVSSKHGDNARTPEADFFSLLDEEKVVNVDVTNVSDGPYCKAWVPAAEEILEFHKGQRSRSRVVQWEACEEEKHLDMPSFVPTSHSNTPMAGSFEETCKPDVQCLQGPSRVMCEEEKWNAKRVTLEGINLRLQALENESTLMRHRSVPSNHEQMSMVLLREVMQELQELLKANRNGSTANEALPSMNACVKGGQHKKRHFSDGPGLFS